MELDLTNYKIITHKEAGKFEETRFEKIHNVIFDSSHEASLLVAQEIAGAGTNSSKDPASGATRANPRDCISCQS